jgi:GMP synthase (glutamine-hydrolysing)
VGDQVLCFQGHPEFVHDYSRALLDARQEHLGDEVYQRAIASLKLEHQGDLVGEWMLRFVAHAPSAKESAA